MRMTPDEAATVLLRSYGFPLNQVMGILNNVNSIERRRMISLGEELAGFTYNLNVNSTTDIDLARKKFRSMLFSLYGQTAMYKNSGYFSYFRSVKQGQFDAEYKLRYADGGCLEKQYDLRAHDMAQSIIQLPVRQSCRLLLDALRAEERYNDYRLVDAPLGLLKAFVSSGLTVMAANTSVLSCTYLGGLLSSCLSLPLPVILSPGVVAAASPAIAMIVLCSWIWVGANRYIWGAAYVQESDILSVPSEISKQIFDICYGLADLTYYNFHVKFMLPAQFNSAKSFTDNYFNNLSTSQPNRVLPFM